MLLLFLIMHVIMQHNSHHIPKIDAIKNISWLTSDEDINLREEPIPGAVSSKVGSFLRQHEKKILIILSYSDSLIEQGEKLS